MPGARKARIIHSSSRQFQKMEAHLRRRKLGRKWKRQKPTLKTCTKCSIRTSNYDTKGKTTLDYDLSSHRAIAGANIAWCNPTLDRRMKLEEDLKQANVPDEEKRKIISELEKRESDYTRLQRQRMTSEDFEPLTIIGRGAFGEVSTTSFHMADAAPCKPMEMTSHDTWHGNVLNPIQLRRGIWCRCQLPWTLSQQQHIPNWLLPGKVAIKPCT